MVEIKLLNGTTKQVDMDKLIKGDRSMFKGSKYDESIPGLFWPIKIIHPVYFVHPMQAHVEGHSNTKLDLTHFHVRRTMGYGRDAASWYAYPTTDDTTVGAQTYFESIERLGQFILLNWPNEAKHHVSYSIKGKSYNNTVEQCSVGVKSKEGYY